MSPLRSLAPDQRAVLELLLRQGRSYEELSDMLGLPEAGVRDRAHAALAALAPERVAPVGEDGAVADWILGQQDDQEAGRTSGAIARMPAWHAWASEVTDRLSEVDGAELPELPEPDAGEPAPAPAKKPPTAKRNATAKRPRPVREQAAKPKPDPEPKAAPAGAVEPEPVAATAASTPLRSSRLGGALVIGLAVILVGGFLAWFLTRDGDDDPQRASTSGTATPTATATPRVVNEIPLKGVGNQSEGLMRVFQRPADGLLVFALAANKVPQNKPREAYGVWFTKKGGAPRGLGFAQTQVGKDNTLVIGGPQEGQEKQLASWLADYDGVVIARPAPGNAAKQRPGQVILSGTLPGGGN